MLFIKLRTVPAGTILSGLSLLLMLLIWILIGSLILAAVLKLLFKKIPFLRFCQSF